MLPMHCEDIFWNGPHDWSRPRQRTLLSELSGVYMWAVESDAGYVVYSIGITRRSVHKRHLEHRRKILRGEYTLLDIDAMRQGVRKEIWHGLWAGHNSDERTAEFDRCKEELVAVALKQMAAFKIFVATATDMRLQQRMEAALVAALYDAPEPHCGLPDRGMALSPRREHEQPLMITNLSDHHFVNLPATVIV